MAYEINEYLTSVIAILHDRYGKDMWKHIQWWDIHEQEWYNCSEPSDLNLTDDYEYRIKPGTVI